MRVTADTNILVSSTFWAGLSDKIIKKIEEGKIELFLSKEILEEFYAVLDYEDIKKKIKDKNLEMRRTVEKIISISEIVEPKQKFNIIKEDVEDNKILECAVECNANYIISQDNHLLRLKEFKGIKILKPEEFLKIIE